MRKKIFIVISIVVSIVLITFNLHVKSQEDRIIIGARDYAEQYILGEMLTLLIEEYTDLEVEQKFGYSTINVPITEGEVDLYPAYTGTGWAEELDRPFIYQPNILYQQVKKAYLEELDVLWLDRYGFNNTYGLAMRNQQAEDQGIYTYSDLALKGNPLIFGAEDRFYNREDGYPGLEKKYDFHFKEKKILDINKKYEAIDEGEVDVLEVFSTDGLLGEYDLYLLDDDQHYFPPYEAATIIRMDTLEKHPELEDVLNKLGGQINNEEMSQLNYIVENGEMDAKEAARLFLISKGLIN